MLDTVQGLVTATADNTLQLQITGAGRHNVNQYPQVMAIAIGSINTGLFSNLFVGRSAGSLARRYQGRILDIDITGNQIAPIVAYTGNIECVKPIGIGHTRWSPAVQKGDRYSYPPDGAQIPPKTQHNPEQQLPNNATPLPPINQQDPPPPANIVAPGPNDGDNAAADGLRWY